MGKLGLFDFMLVMIKAILYEGAVALRASMNFRKDLRGSKPWGDSRRSRWGGEDCGDRRQDQRYGRKKLIGEIFSTRGQGTQVDNDCLYCVFLERYIFDIGYIWLQHPVQISCIMLLMLPVCNYNFRRNSFIRPIRSLYRFKQLSDYLLKLYTAT